MLRSIFLTCLAGLFSIAPLSRAAEPGAAEGKKDAGGQSVVAVFKLDAAVTESPVDESLPFFAPPGVSLKDLVERLRKAGEDPRVKGVVLLSEGSFLGAAQLEEVGQALKEIRKNGKEVYAHSDSLGMGQYVLFSGASRVSVVPTADLWITGLHGEQPYLRGLLDKLGVKPDFLACGDYKSAGETFTRDTPSPEADRMHNWLFDGLYESCVRQIAAGRGVEPAKVRAWIDAGPYTAESAKKAGLVDAVEHRQEFEQLLREKHGQDVVFEKKYGKAKPPQMDFSSPFAFIKLWGDLVAGAQKKRSPNGAVGVVYVEGPIMLGGGVPSIFGAGGAAMSSDVRKALDEAVRDDTIKAVVLRVNSPGGSAVASEIILDATRRVKAKKPFVVSMGDVAGSGGYYVACAADTIYADENTITASIGVVAGKMVTTDMWKKAGITFKEYKRGRNAALLGSSDVWTAEERAKIQAWMDEIYGVFRKHVADARGDRLKKPLDELTGGRVFTGRQALEYGLIDRIGTMHDAVKHAADQAKLTDYDVRVVPEPKNLIELILEDGAGGKDAGKRLDASLGGNQQNSLADLAMPYLQGLDPQRTAVIRTALQRLQLIQNEGVVLMMPEVVVPH